MRGRALYSIVLILSSAACVDRVFIDVGSGAAFGIVIDGHISDQPGPYRIEINSGHDLENRFDRHPISVKRLVLSDDEGTKEVLTEVNEGVYQTKPTGIRGTVGRVYTLHIETFDVRFYESIPDTLFPPGRVDSIYYSFKEFKTPDNASNYGFNVLFDASAGLKNNYHFLWKFTGTFQADTHPELCLDPMHPCEPCTNDFRCNQCSICNIAPFCSGLRNVGSVRAPVYIRVGPCECCTCWYNLYNPTPILSDNQYLRFGRFIGVTAYFVPLNQWIFQHKVHVDVSQMSLSRQAFAFWKAVKDQQNAINSLFQPVTGKIPNNFVQLSGMQAPIAGLFFATAISSKMKFITRDDVPNPSVIPPISIGWNQSCLTLFPHSTTTKPAFWD